MFVPERRHVMKSLRRALALGVIPLLVVVFALIAAGASAHRTAAAATTFTDPTGDSQGAADITAVAVSDDYGSGTINVSVTAAGYGAGVPDGFAVVTVYLNTDKNEATPAGQQGVEYTLMAANGPNGSDWGVLQWNGTEYALMSETPTMSFVRSGDVMTWTLNKSDLGGTSGFTLFAMSGKFDANAALIGKDAAPDDGYWSYDLSVAPLPPPPPTTTTAASVKPLIGTPATTPGRAVAGKKFSVSFPVTRSDNGKPLATGKMICDPSVQGKVIRHAESFRGGTARLTFTVPKSAKGKLLKVKVTIRAGDKSTTRIATFRVM
jgi:hypothetical protein